MDKTKNDGSTPLYIAAENGHLDVVQFLVEQGEDVNFADNFGWTPLHRAAEGGHKEIISCLVSWGSSVSAKAYLDIDELEVLLPIDVTDDEEIKQHIRDEEIRHRDHGHKRAVIPIPTAWEQEQERMERAHREAEDYGGEVVIAMDEGQGQGQASANASAVADEDDNDSGSDEEHEVAYWRSLKRQRTSSCFYIMPTITFAGV